MAGLLSIFMVEACGLRLAGRLVVLRAEAVFAALRAAAGFFAAGFFAAGFLAAGLRAATAFLAAGFLTIGFFAGAVFAGAASNAFAAASNSSKLSAKHCE